MSVILPNKLLHGIPSVTEDENSVARFKQYYTVTGSNNVFINDNGELSIGRNTQETDVMLSLTQRANDIRLLNINDYGGCCGSLLTLTKDGKFGFKVVSPLDQFHVNSDSRFTGKLSVGYSSFSQVGNSLDIWQIYTCKIAALSSTRIVFIDLYNDKLRAYDWDGIDWSQVGNEYAISSNGYDAITALNSTDIAFVDGTNDELRTYRFDGTNFSQIGSGLSIPGIGVPALTSLNSTRIVFVDSALDSLRTYDWNGSTWSQIGNSLNISPMNTPTITAINNNEIAFIDNYNKYLRTYSFDGTNWTLIGSLYIGVNYTSITALNNTDIVLIDNQNNEFRLYRWNGAEWNLFGIPLPISGIGVPTICALNGTDFAYADDALDSLRVYRFSSTISFVADNNMVGIGTAPTDDTLEVRGSSVNNLLKISKYDGTPGVRLLLGGNFGLGENNPEVKFHIKGEEPYIYLHNSTYENIAYGRESVIHAIGHKLNGERHILAKILFSHFESNNDQKGLIAFHVNNGSDGNNPSLVIAVDSYGNAKFGDGGITNYVNISKIGIDLYGTAQKWTCIDLTPENIGLPSTNPPLRDEYQGFSFDRYDRSTEEQTYFIAHLKTDYAEGTASIRCHFGIIVENPPSGTGNETVVIGYEYKKITPGTDIFDFSSGTITGTVEITIIDGESPRLMHESGTVYLDTTGFFKEDILLFRFFRDSTNANDTYDNEAVAADNDAWVGIYHMEYLLDGLGGS